MTPIEALNIYRQVALRFSASGADHDEIRKAYMALEAAVNELAALKQMEADRIQKLTDGQSAPAAPAPNG